MYFVLRTNSVMESHKLIRAKIQFYKKQFISYAANTKSHFPAIKLKFSLMVWLYNVFVYIRHVLPGREHH
jgi:hypothetical protein